jgi:signal transduction histidine kinase
VQRRILVVALIAVALAVTLLGVPLGVLQRQYLRSQERGELVREAVTVAVSMSRDLRETDGKPTLADPPAGMNVAVYDGTGKLLTGVGPDAEDTMVHRALEHAAPVDGLDDDDLVAAVPVMRGEDVIAVVRASSERSALLKRELLVYAAVGGVAVFAALMAMLLALRLAWRLAAPITDLQMAAEELGDGNFAVRAPSSGIKELDAVAGSMNVTAARLGQLIDRERAFAAHASHQLRTPLTALRLRLDAALHGNSASFDTAATEAMAIVDDLETTVRDLLAVSRGRTNAVSALDLDGVLAGLPTRWEGLLAAEGRTLVIRSDDPPVGAGRVATVRQVLDVLIDNAYRHGGGAVHVVAREASGALAIDVTDEGRPGASSSTVDAEFARISAGGRTGSTGGSGAEAIAGSDGATRPSGPRTGDTARSTGPHRPGTSARRGGTGIGLGLARSLLVADGGRLLLSSIPGRTRATVLLPAAEPTPEHPTRAPGPSSAEAEPRPFTEPQTGTAPAMPPGTTPESGPWYTPSKGSSNTPSKGSSNTPSAASTAAGRTVPMDRRPEPPEGRQSGGRRPDPG